MDEEGRRVASGLSQILNREKGEEGDSLVTVGRRGEERREWYDGFSIDGFAV